MKKKQYKFKLTIGKKIVLGYIPVQILLITISVFTLLRLNEVNRINKEIIQVDLVVNNESESLIEILMDQESYCQRYMILKSQDLLSLLWKRDQEFKNTYENIKRLSLADLKDSLILLGKYHSDYNEYLQTCITYLDSSESLFFTTADSLRENIFDKQVFILNNFAKESKKNLHEKNWRAAEIGQLTFRTVSIIATFGIMLVIAIAMLITHGIVRAIKTLKIATDYVSQGKFNDLPSVKNKDELGDLSVAFNEMATRLKQLEEISMDSSPLTRLPGGIAIENVVKNRIDIKASFAFCMFDLDNFKPFNDRYGYSRGNAVIKATAKIILECTKKLGTKDDFVGHIGGDDFVIISTPQKYNKICNTIIERFDKEIIEFYNPEDKENGYILSKTRQGEKLTFPIMAISISALDSEKSYVENYIQVGEIIAELKKYAKSFSESKLVVDRRGGIARTKHEKK